MLKWLKENFSFGPLPPDGGRPTLQRETQRLRLQVEEYGRELKTLQEALERYEKGESARTAEAVRAQAERQAERLMAGLAAPVAQLLTQAHRLEIEGEPVQAKDVLAAVSRLVRALEGEGLQPEGRVGETAGFDPNRHEPLGGDAALTPGQQVIVRFVGVSYRGRLIRKAEVERR
jgi:molecular chaperone GrpE (heat shock protein)